MSMTESEAIEILTSVRDDNNWGGSLTEVFSMAITALEEVQQYRAIGTVEELRELKDKATAKVGLSRGQGHEAYLICPSCGSHMKDDQELWDFDGEVVQCKKCKQLVLVDWSN